MSALREDASKLRLPKGDGVLLSLIMLSILARPSNERGVVVQMLVWSASAWKDRVDFKLCVTNIAERHFAS